ncbi:unnamed protein product [Miscanthus lutarioriparius]|uniref:Fe2OG dioxygenase domain-containing protein n=1 Tax=Miscanthus lutarioriparius TaxID=422564 RepID=A0A811R7D9_9POAL|nr:unnamed protein product [Miscanthus lutarioriparius]
MASTAGTDRLAQLKAFDDTKAGVKGLVDAGVTAVPPIFHHPPDPHDAASNAHAAAATIPVIDLASISATNNAAAHHHQLVAQVKAAAETVGFFQVVNHGVPGELLARMLTSVRSFNEEPAESRRPYYTRDPARRVRYQSNFDLFHSPAANWRDTIFIESVAAPEEMPPAFRDVVPEYTRQVRALGAHLLALLSEALGLDAGYLQRDAGCLDGGPALGCHYYPPCPEPRLTLGTTRHSDPSFLTVLLQDDAVGGLQALVGGGGWVDVPPLPGALVVNVGDFLQLMSNDRFKSVEHRVVAVPGTAAARVSAACFFRPTGAAASSRAYGPLPDLVNPPEAPRYRSVTTVEFLGYHRQKGLDGRSALDQFRLLP